LNSKMWYLK